MISAAQREGTRALCEAIMNHLEALAREREENPEAAQRESALQEAMQQEARERIAQLRNQRQGGGDGSGDDHGDDGDTEVIYAP